MDGRQGMDSRQAKEEAAARKRLRILFLIDEIVGKGAGTERQLLDLIRAVDRARFDPVLCCLRESDWLRENDPGCEAHVLGFRSFHGRTFLPSLIRLARFIRRTGVDVVQTFFVDSSLLGPLAARLGRARCVGWRRDMGYWHTRSLLWALRVIDPLLDGVLVNARAVGEIVAAAEWVPRHKIHVIPNGIDVARFEGGDERARALARAAISFLYGIPPVVPLVGVVANLRPVKRIDDFIHAAGIIHRACPSARFLIVGKGALREQLEALASRLGIGSRIHMIEDCVDTAHLLAALDVGVLTSESEGCSNALLEYMAAGLGIVATRVGGNVELIEDGKNGILIERAAPKELAAAILSLLSEPESRARLGREARAAAIERHSRGRMVRDVERYCLNLAGPNGDRRDTRCATPTGLDTPR